MVRSRLIIGRPGSGKSEFIRSEIIKLVATGMIAIVLMDPHGQLARKIMLDLMAAGRERRVLYDRLGKFDRVLAAITPTQSVSSNPWERQQENLAQIMGYANLFWSAGQREETGSLIAHPMTFAWLVNSLSMVLYQKEPTSLLALKSCFSPGTPQFDKLLAECTEPETVYQWKQIDALYKARSYRELEGRLGGAQRLVQTVLQLPEFAARMGGQFDLLTALKSKQIIILDGADAIPEARTALYRGWNLQIFKALRDNFALTSKPIPTLIVIDEAPATNAIGPVEVDFLREARKMGGSLWIAGQDLSFMDN